MREREKKEQIERGVLRCMIALLLAATVILIENKEVMHSLQGLQIFSGKNYATILMFSMIFTVILCECLTRLGHMEWEYFMFPLLMLCYGLLAGCQTNNIYELTMLTFFVVLSIGYSVERSAQKKQLLCFSQRDIKVALLFLAAATLLYVGSLVVLRVVLFKTVTFDFGIFVQMFHYMKNTGIPYTTCERYQLLSHFTIHFSPFFYLLLPIYTLFPSPVTLILLQLIAVVSGAVPLYLMCKRKRLQPLMSFAIVSAYLLYPTFRGGLFYDFHENKFLAPVILWLLYFWEEEENAKKKWLGVSIFSILLLSIKEDAAIYAACIGLYYLLSGGEKKEDRKGGIILFVTSVVYFFVVFFFMKKYGDAGSAITSFGRYENLMTDGYSGISELVMNILKDPAYVCTQLLDQEKLEFLLWMLVPVLFLPLKGRRYAEYILLLPLLLFNLLSNYEYQHSIYYQYAYGSGALVIYLVYKNAGRMKKLQSRKTSWMLIAASLIVSAGCLSEKNTYYEEYRTQKEAIVETKELLEKIPKGASVSATSTYVPPLAQRNVIYRHEEGDEMDYIVLSLRTSQRDKMLEEAEEYLMKGYEEFGRVDQMVIVLKKKRIDI